MNAPTPRECEHGQLARQCEICELRAELKRVKEALKMSDSLLDAAGERAERAEADAEALRKAIKNLRDVKGRYHTEQATLALFKLLDDAAKEGK